MERRVEELLEEYRGLVLRWNRRVPLVSRRTPEESITRLIEHSLAGECKLPERIRLLMDIGSGAGLPGIPLALRRPGLEVRLFERSEKKQMFLVEAIRRLGLGNVELRAEEFRPEKLEGERPLAVTAIGLGGYGKLAAACRERMREGDGFLFFVGRDTAERTASELGGWKLKWCRLEGSRSTGVAWIEL